MLVRLAIRAAIRSLLAALSHNNYGPIGRRWSAILSEMYSKKGNKHIASLVLGFLAQFNSIERTLVRSRMAAGYENNRSKGGVVGRKEGYKKSDKQMINKYPKVIRLIRKEYSLRSGRETWTFDLIIIKRAKIPNIRQLQRVTVRFMCICVHSGIRIRHSTRLLPVPKLEIIEKTT